MVQKKNKGKYGNTNVHHLKDGQDTLTSEQDISNKLGQYLKKKLFYRKLPSRIISKNLKAKRKNWPVFVK